MKLIRLYLVVALILLAILFSCSWGEDNVQEIVDHQENPNGTPQAMLDAANKEFLEGILSSNNSRSLSGASESERAEIRNKLIGLAWSAYYSGNDKPFFDYLKAKGLEETFQTIATKYRVAEMTTQLCNKNNKDLSRAVTQDFFDKLETGHIVLCYRDSAGSSTSALGWIIPGKWKHAGIVDHYKRWEGNPDYCILSASNETSHGFAVGYETREKWARETAVKAMDVNGRTQANAESAIDYGRRFLGRSFNFFTSRDDDNAWYCSKLVWRCYRHVGIDIEPSPWWLDNYVTPQDIAEANDTRSIAGDN